MSDEVNVNSLPDYSVDDDQLPAESMVILNTIIDRSGIAITDYTRGAELFALGIKQGKRITNSNSSWVMEIAQDLHAECDGLNIDIKDAVETILDREVSYIISTKCPAVYRMAPKDFGTSGNNALSSAWRKLAGALTYADCDIMGEHNTIKKCDSFRNKKKKEAEKLEAEKNRQIQLRDAAIVEIRKTNPDFKESDEGAEVKIAAAIAARQKRADERAAKNSSAEVNDHALDSLVEGMTDDEKYTALGLTERQQEFLRLANSMDEFETAKGEELGNVETAHDQAQDIIDSMRTKIADRLQTAIDNLEKKVA